MRCAPRFVELEALEVQAARAEERQVSIATVPALLPGSVLFGSSVVAALLPTLVPSTPTTVSR